MFNEWSLQKYLNKFVIVFLDDIIVYSKTKEEHEEHIRLFLSRKKVYSKLRKCSFYQGRIHYLGHIIYEEVVSIDLENIRAIMEWPTPKNVSEVRSFMGLVGYYRRFIKGFSKLAHSITSLRKKGVKFDWTSKCEDHFQKLKEMITSAPVLKIADPEGNLVVCTDACKQGIGGVLM